LISLYSSSLLLVNRASSSSSAHAPSSFHRSKRVRLTNSSEGGRSIPSRSGSRSGSLPVPGESFLNANNTGSMSSRGSHGSKSHTHPFNREFSYRDGPPLAPSASRTSHAHSIQSQRGNHAPSRRSLSQASIPISALVSPHAPSITRSGTFHMRDPRKPAPIQSTPWALSFPDHCQAGESRWALHGWVGRGGSPLHAWLFFFGFVCFPLWWAAAFIPIPKTRRLGGTDAEKGVILDDPQVEHGLSPFVLLHHNRFSNLFRRRKIMAISLPHHGPCFSVHLYPIYRSRHRFHSSLDLLSLDTQHINRRSLERHHLTLKCLAAMPPLNSPP